MDSHSVDGSSVDGSSSDGPAQRAPVCRFGPDRRLIALTGVLALVAAAFAAMTSDPEGRLLAVVVAIILAAYTVTDLIWWPRLVASAAGLRVRTPALRADLPWPLVDEVRVDEKSRYGLASRTLEIDAGPRLVVLSKRSLGADPRDVLALVTAFDPRGRHS